MRAESERPALDKIERLQSYYTRLVPEIHDMCYTDRLSAMNLTSIQRRFDRYRILYTRKVVRGEVPPVGIKLRDKDNARDGIKMEIPDKRKMKSLRLDSLSAVGPE